MASGALTIGKLAEAAGVPVSTIRYYEREGLLAPDERSGSNYRLYGPGSLSRLRFMRAAHGAGLTLGDIRTLLACREEGGEACHDVQGILGRRLEKVVQQLEHLVEVKGTLQRWIRECHEREPSGRCAFIGSLDAQAREESGGERSDECADCP